MADDAALLAKAQQMLDAGASDDEVVAALRAAEGGGGGDEEAPAWLTPHAARDLGKPRPGKPSVLEESMPRKVAPAPSLWERAKQVAGHVGSALVEAPEAISGNPREAGWVAARKAGDFATGGLSEKPVKSREDIEEEMSRLPPGAPQYLAHLQGLAARAPTREQLARNQETKAAEDNRQKLAAIGGAAAGTALGPGGASARVIGKVLPVATGLVGRGLRAATIGGGSGVAEGTGRALVAGKGLGEALEEGADAGEAGGLLGAAGELVGAGAKRLLRGAPARADKQLVQQFAKGADPTHSRRLAGVGGEGAAGVVSFAERNPEMLRVAGKPDKVAVASEAIADRASKQTGPIYDKLDAAVGKVPIDYVVRGLDEQIATYAAQAGNEQFRDALQTVRNNVIAAAKAAKVTAWPHKELRAWVTRVLKAEQRTVGSLAQTQNYEIADAVHDAADSVLKRQIAEAGEVVPGLAADIARLKELNTDIAFSLKVNQAAKNAVARDYYAKKGGLGDVVAAGIAGTILGVGGGLPAAAAGYAATQGIPAVAGKVNRGATRAAANFVEGKGRIGRASQPESYVPPAMTPFQLEADRARRRRQENR